MTAPRRLHVVLNPRSGTLQTLDAAQVARQIEDRFRQNAWEVTTTLVEGGKVPEALRKAVEGPAETILVGGGDGTIAAAVEHIRGSGKTLGVLPLGTMNLLAKDLDLPENWEDALEVLVQGDVRQIDVAEVNGIPFTCSAVLGIYPKMSETREAVRDQPFVRKWLRVLVAGLRVIASYPLLRLQIQAEGDAPELVRTRLVLISNNAYANGRIGQLPRRRALDEGHLGVYVVDSPSRWKMLWVTAGLLLGWWDRLPEMRHFTGRELVIRPRLRRYLRVMIDGELVRLRTPLKFRIEAEGLAVLAAPRKRKP